jgi:hypothetical protein
MSDARGNQELAGLARSVDQLFAVARAPSDEESEPSPPDMVEPAALDVPEPEPVGDVGPGSADAQSSPSAHPEPAASGALQPPDADRWPVPPLGVQEPAPRGDVPPDECATTALDLAVDAYLAGDRDRAREIERLAV